MPAFVPIVLGLGGLGLLALTFAQKSVAPPNRTPQSTPQVDPPVTPPAPPKANTFPAGTVTAVVIAPKGVNIRSAPDERASKVLTAVPQYERVAILNSTSPPLAATPAATQGWWEVNTLSGVHGYATAEWLFFGTDAEAHLSDADFQKQQQEHANDEDPIFQGLAFGGGGPAGRAVTARGAADRTNAQLGLPTPGGQTFAPKPFPGADSAAPFSRFQPQNSGLSTAHFTAPSVKASEMRPNGNQTPAVVRQAIADRRRRRPGRPGYLPGYTAAYIVAPSLAPQTTGTLLRCVAPAGCYLRALSGGQLVPTGIVVDNSAAVLALGSQPGPKTDARSPSPGGWTRVRFSPRSGGTYDGYLPSEWLVRA